MSSTPTPTRLTRSSRLHRSVRLSAFTLIELLIVIAIIGVLATMSVSLLASATEDAKTSSTQSRISQIKAILQLQMEDYEVRRLPIPNRVLLQYVVGNRLTFDGTVNVKNDRLQLKYLRRQILMDVINAEMPRPTRQGGIGGSEIEYGVGGVGVVDLMGMNALVKMGVPVFPSTAVVPNIGNQLTDANVYPAFANVDNTKSFGGWLTTNYPAPAGVNSLRSVLGRTRSGGVSRWGIFAGNIAAGGNQILPAEYLYYILSDIQIDGQSAVELLGNSAIGDSDGDGVLEVIDAWGEPFVFDIEQAGWDIDGNVVRTNDSDNFVPLDPRVPRSLGDLRFVVGSTRIPETLPIIERAAKGLVQ